MNANWFEASLLQMLFLITKLCWYYPPSSRISLSEKLWLYPIIREFTIRYVAQYDDPWRLGHECYLGDVLLIAHSTTISLLKFASSHVVISTLVRIQYLLFLTAPVYISFLLFGRNKIFIHSLLQTQFHKFSIFCRQDSFVTENGLSYSTS